jgi:hypothetical protein
MYALGTLTTELLEKVVSFSYCALTVPFRIKERAAQPFLILETPPYPSRFLRRVGSTPPAHRIHPPHKCQGTALAVPQRRKKKLFPAAAGSRAATRSANKSAIIRADPR